MAEGFTTSERAVWRVVHAMLSATAGLATSGARAFLPVGRASTRPRAPSTSPRRMGGDVEAAVVAVRRGPTELGMDHGRAAVQWHLSRGVEATCVPNGRP